VSVTVSLLTCSLHSSARGIVRKEEAPNPQEIEKSHFGFHQYRSSIKKVPKVGTVMLSKKKTNARLSSCLLIRIPELKEGKEKHFNRARLNLKQKSRIYKTGETPT
jgi:hypothetical protein